MTILFEFSSMGPAGGSKMFRIFYGPSLAKRVHAVTDADSVSESEFSAMVVTHQSYVLYQDLA